MHVAFFLFSLSLNACPSFSFLYFGLYSLSLSLSFSHTARSTVPPLSFFSQDSGHCTELRTVSLLFFLYPTMDLTVRLFTLHPFSRGTHRLYTEILAAYCVTLQAGSRCTVHAFNVHERYHTKHCLSLFPYTLSLYTSLHPQHSLTLYVNERYMERWEFIYFITTNNITTCYLDVWTLYCRVKCPFLLIIRV